MQLSMQWVISCRLGEGKKCFAAGIIPAEPTAPPSPLGSTPRRCPPSLPADPDRLIPIAASRHSRFLSDGQCHFASDRMPGGSSPEVSSTTDATRLARAGPVACSPSSTSRHRRSRLCPHFPTLTHSEHQLPRRSDTVVERVTRVPTRSPLISSSRFPAESY